MVSLHLSCIVIGKQDQMVNYASFSVIFFFQIFSFTDTFTASSKIGRMLSPHCTFLLLVACSFSLLDEQCSFLFDAPSSSSLLPTCHSLLLAHPSSSSLLPPLCSFFLTLSSSFLLHYDSKHCQNHSE